MDKNKKELIREAAIKIMAREGFYNTKASWIAEEAGIAVGTIYNYFNSKEEILEYIFLIELKKRAGFISNIKKEKISIINKLERFLELHFQEIKNNPELGKILVREKEFPRNDGRDHIGKYLKEIPGEIGVMIQKGLDEGELKKCNPEIIGASIFGSIQGIVEKTINNNELELLDQAAEEIVDLLKNGLQKG